MKKIAIALLAALLFSAPALAKSTSNAKNNLKVNGTLTVVGATTHTGPVVNSGNMTVGGTLGVTGVATFTAKPTLTTATLFANGDTITIQDLGDANIVQTEGTQTINGSKTFGTPLLKASVNNVSKRYVMTALVSPPSGSAVDSTVYRAFILPGRACTITRISFVAQTPPATGTNTIKVLKASSSGNSMLSTSTFNADTLSANTVTQGTLTGTGADLQLTAAQGVYVEYTGTQTGTDAANVNVSVEIEPDDF